MNSDKIILRTEGLTKHYGGVHALDDANFELRDGEHIAIVGDNGAGKSTFVRQITGVEQPTGGKIFFTGRRSTSRARSRRATPASRPYSRTSPLRTTWTCRPISSSAARRSISISARSAS
jgi:ABC-type branched-subunit amino acid transport system ATPase component